MGNSYVEGVAIIAAPWHVRLAANGTDVHTSSAAV